MLHVVNWVHLDKWKLLCSALAYKCQPYEVVGWAECGNGWCYWIKWTTSTNCQTKSMSNTEKHIYKTRKKEGKRREQQIARIKLCQRFYSSKAPSNAFQMYSAYETLFGHIHGTPTATATTTPTTTTTKSAWTKMQCEFIAQYKMITKRMYEKSFATFEQKCTERFEQCFLHFMCREICSILLRIHSTLIFTHFFQFYWVMLCLASTLCIRLIMCRDLNHTNANAI